MERYRAANAKLAALSIRQSMVGRWFFMIVGTVFSILPAFVYWLAGWLAIQGDPSAPTPGDIVAFTTLQSRLFFPLGPAAQRPGGGPGRAWRCSIASSSTWTCKPSIVDEPTARDAGPRRDVRGAIRFRNVSFAYDDVGHGEPTMGEAELAMDAATHGPDEPDPWSRHDGDAEEVAACDPGPNAGRPAVRARRHRLRGAARPARGAGGAVRVRQDHHHVPGAAAVRRHRRRRGDRRHRRARDHAREPGRGDRRA